MTTDDTTPTDDSSDSGGLSRRQQRIGAGIGIILASIIGLVLFVTKLLPWMAGTFGILATFALFVGFLAGVGIIPLFGYGIPGVLPVFLAEPLANTLWMVASLGLGPVELYQNADDSYDVRRADTDMEPVNHWGKLAGVPFALNYERCEEAFGTFIEKIDGGVLDGEGDLPGKFVEYGPERSGIQTTVDASDLDDGPTAVVRLHQVLERLQSACGVTEIDRAELDALTEHAGDSGLDGRTQMWGVVVMGLAGAAMGYFTLF